MIQKLNSKITTEVRSLAGYTEFGNRINQLVGEVERATELNLERANWLLNEWIDKYKDLGYRLQVLCHLKPSLKYPASKSWTNSEDIMFDPDKTIIAQLDLYPRFWNCMEKSIGREKVFLGLTLEMPPNFDYEIAPIVHNKKYINEDPDNRDRGRGNGTDRSGRDTGREKPGKPMKKTRAGMGKNSVKVSGMGNSDQEFQTGVKKQELGFGSDKIDNPVNFDQLMTKDRKMKYQTGNALKNLDNAGPPMPKEAEDLAPPELKKKKKKKKKVKAKKAKGEDAGEEEYYAKKKKVDNDAMENLMFKK